MIAQQVFDMVNAGIITLNKDLEITDWNKWIEYRSELTKDKVLGKKLLELFPNLDKDWFKTNCRSVIKFGNYAFFSQRLHQFCIPLKPGGKFRNEFNNMQQNCTLGPIRDEKRKITGFFLIINDVTEITHFEKELVRMANVDGLTSVYNRTYFDKRIEEEFLRHKRYKRPMCVIMLDIDFFKVVNDTLGHQYGDYVLKELVILIQKRIREIDILARYGGEEFILILPETDLDQAVVVAESLRGIVEQHKFISSGETMDITISLGVSDLKKDLKNPDALIKEADDALYHSKENGRNMVSTIVSKNKR